MGLTWVHMVMPKGEPSAEAAWNSSLPAAELFSVADGLVGL
jgi:hypothetical protein